MSFRSRSAETGRSVIAAAVLTGLIVAVFVSSQYSGPTSSVLAFHNAVATGNAALLESVLEGDPDASANRRLINLVAAHLAGNPQVRIEDSEKDGRTALVIVSYNFNGRGTALLPFVLVKDQNRWLVSGKRTYDLAGRNRLP